MNDDDETRERTLEERGLMVCPFCDGTSGPPYDQAEKLEPAYVNLCHVCMGDRYLNPSRYLQWIVDHGNQDICMDALEAAKLTEEEQEWL